MATLQRAKAPVLWWVEDGRVRVRPHPGQERVLDSQRRFVLMLAGSQGGKTVLGPVWLLTEIQAKGPGDYLVVAPSFPLLKRKTEPEFRKLFEHTYKLGTWNGADHIFTYHKTKSQSEETRVMFGSASHPNSLESATAKAAWLDECGQSDFRLGSWEAIQRRLALNQGRVLGTTTPYDLGWLKQQWYDLWRAGDPDYDVIQFESTENPSFPLEEYERAQRTLPSWKFDMFYRGLLSRPAGLIYEDYSDDYREEGGHKVHPFNLPANWPRSGGLDFGAVHTARLVAAHDPVADVYYIYDEYLGGGQTTAEHAAAARDWMAGVNWQTWTGGARSEDQQRWDWASAGVSVQEPRVWDVEAGIDRVIELFKTKRLYVFDTCKGLRDELGSYSRVLDEAGNPTEAIRDKATFHLLDAARYLCDGLSSRGAIWFA